MGLFSKRQAPPSLAGRAAIHRGAGSFDGGMTADGVAKMNNTSANARVGLPVHLDLVSVEDGAPGSGLTERLTWRVANWVRLVLIGLDDGSGRYSDAPAPGSILLPVRVDPATRRIVAVDDDVLERELAPWRAAANDVFKRTEGALRDAYQAQELAGFAKHEVPGILREWGGALREMRDDARRAHDAEIPPGVVAKRLAEADAQGAALRASDPAVASNMRAAVLPACRARAEAVRDGHAGPPAFDLDIEVYHRMGVLTAEELAELRATAGTPGFD